MSNLFWLMDARMALPELFFPKSNGKPVKYDKRRRCQKAGHHRECAVQKPSAMGISYDLTDTVAGFHTH
jgi:hypothetical protein